MSKFNAQDVTNTAWAFATAGQFDASLFFALANAAKLNMSKFKMGSRAMEVQMFVVQLHIGEIRRR